MAQPQVPIDVDPETGIWRTDGLPMMYLPRHFMVNMQQAIEGAMGIAAYRAILYAACELSALQWCRAEARTHGLTAVETLRHYFNRMSQRGHGQVSLEALDEAAGTASIIVRNSAYALGYGPQAGRRVCYVFEGSFAGGMRYVLEQAGRGGEPVCRETACLAEGAPECRFDVTLEA
jgi:predicted hydrocarbon binding protein